MPRDFPFGYPPLRDGPCQPVPLRDLPSPYSYYPTPGMSGDCRLLVSQQRNRMYLDYARRSHSSFSGLDTRVIMRGIPFHVKLSEIETFFAPLKLVDVRVGYYSDNRMTGDGRLFWNRLLMINLRLC